MNVFKYISILAFVCVLIPFTSAQSLSKLSEEVLDSLMKEQLTARKNDKAMLYAREKLKRSEVLGKDSIYTKNLAMVATLTARLGESVAAEKLYLEAIELAKQTMGNTNPTLAKLYSNIALTYRDLGQMDKVETPLKSAKAIYKKIYGEEHPLHIQAIAAIVYFYKLWNRFEEAEVLAKEEIRINEKVFGEEDPNYIWSLVSLSNIYSATGRADQSLVVLKKIKDLRKKVFGVEHPQYAASLSLLADGYLNLDQLEEAEPLRLEATRIFKKIYGAEHPVYADVLKRLANLYGFLNRTEGVEELYLEAKSIFEKTIGTEDYQYAEVLESLGNYYIHTADYKKAEMALLEASSIYLKVMGENTNYAGSLAYLGRLYLAQGQFSLAEEYLLEALAIYQKENATRVHFYAAALDDLAGIYEATGRYEKAMELYLQSIEILKGFMSENYPDLAYHLNKVGFMKTRLNDFEGAKDYFAKAILANAKSKDSSMVDDLDQIAKAEFTSGERIVETLLGRYEMDKIFYDSLQEMTYLNHAYKTLETAITLNERARNEFLGEQDKLRTLSQMSELVNETIDVGLSLAKLETEPQYIEAVFAYAEQNKSILLADATKAQRARSMSDLPDSLAYEELFLQSEKGKLKKELENANSPDQRRIVLGQQNVLNLKIQRFLTALKKEYPKYHALKYENITAKSKDIQALLDDKSALVEYFVGEEQTYLFIIKKDKVKLFPIAISRDKLNNKIKILRRCLSEYSFILKEPNQAYNLYTETAHWFYTNLLEVALKGEKMEHLIIITDGELGHLPFEVFLTKGSQQTALNYVDLPYLMNDYTISYNYSATLWKENRAHPQAGKTNGKMLACAASYQNSEDWETMMKADSILVSRRSPYSLNLRRILKPLPAAEKEVQLLSEVFEGDFLQGNAANEAFFKANAKNYGVIHLAMHGILHPRLPILSSMAFTENKDSIEDNFLQAFEIAHLNLKADLVVLSACETGFGEFEQGEGVVSLARSFMYAGVPSLVVSLWQVNDVSTSLIMKSFYQNLTRGYNKAEALQLAKFDYLKSTDGTAAHPAFWSAFIQLGDNRPIEITTKGGFKGWLWGALAFIIALAFFLIRRKNNA